MSELLTVSQPPHIRARSNTSFVMFDVVIAMLPMLVAGVYFFGYRAAVVTAVTVAASVLFEMLWCVATKQPTTVKDGSAIVSGMLLAFNLPVTVPLWVPVVGALFMIVIVKMCFGGLGQNIVNPALAGRAFLTACWPAFVTGGFVAAFPKLSLFVNDAVSSATPLAIMKGLAEGDMPKYLDLFIGNIGGCIGETSKLAILIGAAYLLFRRVITLHTPVAMIGTVALLGFIFGADGFFTGEWLEHTLTGGLFLGAFFMATDYTTTPVTRKGMIIFGIGAGCITVFIRLLGGYPEGVSYSILLMNIVTPLIDKYIKPRRFGTKGKKAVTANG